MKAPATLLGTGGAATAGFVTQAIAPHVGNIPDLPYGWMSLSLYAGWTARTVYDGLKDGRTGKTRASSSAAKQRRRVQGYASTGELLANMSTLANRSRARSTRPGLTRKERWRAPGREVGIPIGLPVSRKQRAIVGPLWANPEDAILVAGPARSGKSGQFGSMITDAPGAVVVTSSRPDLWKNTVKNRMEGGRPVWVLNADEDQSLPSTLRWNPVEGCENGKGATERAGYFMAASPGAGGDDGKYWEAAATEYLKALLHAAALKGLPLPVVYAWALNPGDRTALEILKTHPNAETGWHLILEGIYGTTTPTHISSLVSLVKRTLEFLTDKTALWSVTPPDGEGFNVQEFIERKGTLYLVGADRPGSSISPYFSALISYIFEQVKVIARGKKGSRLDPAIMFALDEAPTVAPVPADKWIAEAAGWGVTLVFGVQSVAQIVQRWGVNGAKTIMNNCTVKVIWGGFTDPQDLADISQMCGTVEIPTLSGQPRVESLLPPAAIRLIRQGAALVLHRSTRPVIVKLVPVWARKDFAPVNSAADLKPPMKELLPGRPAGDAPKLPATNGAAKEGAMA